MYDGYIIGKFKQVNVVVFTGSSVRHQAFAAIVSSSSKLNVAAVFHEEGSPLKDLIECRPDASLERQHLAGRDQSEKDFFRLFLEACGRNEVSRSVPRNWYSTNECMAILEKLDVDIILVYGTSIIKGAILHKYDRKILNVHLGLSPYYRGSGTNYFPFVNNEPEFCGATYMYLDEGIDTGEIIHQIRPYILSTDSFHQLSNRFLIKVFETYVLIAENYFDLKFRLACTILQ